MKNKRDIERKIDRLYDNAGEQPKPEERARIDALYWVVGQGDPIIDDEEIKPDSDESIRKVIESLKDSKNKYPEFSVFGDPNWRVADAQVEILEWVLAP